MKDFFPALHTMIGIFSVLACVAGAWKYSGHKKKQPEKKRACYAGYFSVGIFFARYFPARIFSLEISLQDIFFLKSPIPPSKSGMVDPLVCSCSPLSSLTLSYIFVLHYILLHWRYIWRAFIFEKICITSKQ